MEPRPGASTRRPEGRPQREVRGRAPCLGRHIGGRHVGGPPTLTLEPAAMLGDPHSHTGAGRHVGAPC
uniref:Ubiquitin E3 ligase ICP0 n=1 Tax=Human herpesvirus 1 TaxID=10298 RepID=A0A0X8E9E7_HHV1|nr:ubiquitin E3 ligase ICP0 [Human alphaherpesvirus 1]